MRYFKVLEGNGGDLDTQFALLIRYAYEDNETIKNHIFADIKGKRAAFADTLFQSIKQEDLPRNIDEIYELYLNEPITKDDENRFLYEFQVPYQSTGLTMRELYNINPELFSKQLHTHIHNKKIQYVRHSLKFLCTRSELMVKVKKHKSKSMFNSLCKENPILSWDISEALTKYNVALDKSEEKIATNWIEMIDIEPRFRANSKIFSLSASGVQNVSLSNIIKNNGN